MPAYKPGQSGNPNGRPKGSKNERKSLNEKLMLSYIENGDGQRVLDVVRDKALQGSIPAASLFCKYVFFTPEASIVVNDQRDINPDVSEALPLEDIKTIAEIVLKNKKENNE